MSEFWYGEKWSYYGNVCIFIHEKHQNRVFRMRWYWKSHGSDGDKNINIAIIWSFFTVLWSSQWPPQSSRILTLCLNSGLTLALCTQNMTFSNMNPSDVLRWTTPDRLMVTWLVAIAMAYCCHTGLKTPCVIYCLKRNWILSELDWRHHAWFIVWRGPHLI